MGARITQNNFSKAKRQVESAMERAETKTAQDGRDIIESVSPYDPYPDNTHVRETVRVERNVKYTSIVVGDPDRDVIYAGYLEFGTENMQAQPFVSPQVPAIKAIFSQHASSEVKGALK